MSSKKDYRQQNAERRMRHNKWERERCGLSLWGKAVAAFAGIILSIFVIFPLIRLWLD